jgi:hypothetical protein
MNPQFIARWTAATGAVAALIVFLLIGLGVATGVSQEYFEGVHPLAEYTERLVAAAPLLRLGFAFDNLFVLAYTSFFVGVTIVLRESADHRLLNLFLAAMLGVALLDIVENHHIMAMADAAVLGLPLSEGEIRLQAVMSLVKFNLSCLGALLLAPAFPRRTTLGRWTAGFLVVYALYGVLILTAPPQWLDLLGLIRAVFFVVAFVLVSRLPRMPVAGRYESQGSVSRVGLFRCVVHAPRVIDAD